MMIRYNEKSKNPFYSTTTTTTSSTFKAPSKDANQFVDYDYDNDRSRRNNFNNNKLKKNHIICDETWPLDDVINKIESKSNFNPHQTDDKYQQIESNEWHSGPIIISNDFNSGQNREHIDGNGEIIKQWNQGSKVWKDRSIKHRKYKVKKPSTKSYDANNNYLDMDISYTDKEFDSTMDSRNNSRNDSKIYSDHSNDDDDNDDDELSSILLRDVGIQCNLNKKINHGEHLNKFEFQMMKKPPIKIIKSLNDGMVTTFSDVPKLSSPDLILDSDSTDGDAIYSQINKNTKIQNRINNNGINIVYKQPVNKQNESLSKSSSFDVKTKEYSFNISNENYPKISLPNPNLVARSPLIKQKEILEKTISISNTSSSSSSSDVDIDLSLSTNEKKKSKSKPQDENEWLENNSLRLKSSKSASYYNNSNNKRLNKSNIDLREQYLNDETRGGLAAAYKNRQQQMQHQNRQNRTLSLNRMNANNIDYQQKHHHHHQPQNSRPHRHQSQINLGSSRYSDLSSDNIHHHHQHQHHAPRSSSSRLRSKSITQHERDPIVMYIPSVNQQQQQQMLNNDTTKSNVTLPKSLNKSSNKSIKQPPQMKSQSKINLKDVVVTNDNNKQMKRNDLNRRYSMPKDTKFNWLNKFKLKK